VQDEEAQEQARGGGGGGAVCSLGGTRVGRRLSPFLKLEDPELGQGQ
jgi:hypothetical protein